MKRHYWIVCIILLLATCAFFYQYFYKIEKAKKTEEIIGHQKIHARLAAKSFSKLFEKWNSILYYLSNDNNIILLNDSGKNELNKFSKILKDEIYGIMRTDSSGKIIFTAPLFSNIIGADISRRGHMKVILSGHKPVISDVFNTVQGFQAIVIHYPVFKNGQFDGTIAFLLNFEKISKDILDEIKIGNSGLAWLLSKDGIELYCPIHDHIGKSVYITLRKFPEAIKFVGLMLSGKEGSYSYTYCKADDETIIGKKIGYYLPVKINNSFWSIAVTYSEDEITASLMNYRNRLVLILILVFLGGTYLSYFGLKVWVIVKESKLRKKAEEDLTKERVLLHTLIDNLPSGVFIKDIEYKKIIANPIHISSVRGHLKSLGLNSDLTIIGKTDFE